MAEQLNYANASSAGTTRLTLSAVIAHVCALAVAGFFIYASYGKIQDARQFAIEISNYKMAFLDPKYVNIPAILLPWIELVAAIGLLIPATRKGAALIIGGMLIFFIYAVYDAAIVRGLNIKCGCTGKDSGQAGWNTIIQDIVLLAATALSVFLMRTKRTHSNPTTATSNVV